MVDFSDKWYVLKLMKRNMRLFLKEYPKTLLGIRYSMHELSYFFVEKSA